MARGQEHNIHLCIVCSVSTPLQLSNKANFYRSAQVLGGDSQKKVPDKTGTGKTTIET